MSFPPLNLQFVDCSLGKARDFTAELSDTSGAPVLATSILDMVFSVRVGATSAPLLTKSLGAGISLLDSAGIVTALISLSPDDTAQLDPGQTYVVDLSITTTIRGVETACTGRLAVRQP